MIPKKSTPIKHEILIDIFAEGLLSKNEMRVAAYIMRWSWGFDGIGRRQDWTRELKKTKIAKDMKMNEGTFNGVLNKMIRENKIIVKDKCYQFNEHFDGWTKLGETQRFKEQKLGETQRKTLKNSKILPKKLGETQSSTGENPLQDKTSKDRKDNNIKDNKDKPFIPPSIKHAKKKEKNIPPLIEEIITYLNKKVDKNFSAKSAYNKKYIRARLREGYKLSAFKWVVDIKCAEWLNDKEMSKYLRPETLFGTKFEGYLQQSKYEKKEDK